jgi:Rap guanine nucleotide exchange factor 2
MVEDFTVFRQIEQTEYVDHLFNLKSNFGTANLERFSDLVNKETLWVVAELVAEPSLSKRVRMVKHFLKVARQCKEVQNFNSMFAIISGLNHTAVSRMKLTWERVRRSISVFPYFSRRCLRSTPSCWPT